MKPILLTFDAFSRRMGTSTVVSGEAVRDSTINNAPVGNGVGIGVGVGVGGGTGVGVGVGVGTGVGVGVGTGAGTAAGGAGMVPRLRVN